MAQSSARALTLLSLLEARQEWQAEALAGRLEITTRTLRRDIETLRDLGYPIDSVRGPGGGYRLGAGSKLPPLVLDDDQAIAIALALQTAPATIAGMDETLARALSTLRQVLPARLRATTDDLQVTALRNYWEFSAPPISASTLRAVGSALRNRQVLAFDYEPMDAGMPRPPGGSSPTTSCSGLAGGTSSASTSPSRTGEFFASSGYVREPTPARRSLRGPCPRTTSSPTSPTTLIGGTRQHTGNASGPQSSTFPPLWWRSGPQAAPSSSPSTSTDAD